MRAYLQSFWPSVPPHFSGPQIRDRQARQAVHPIHFLTATRSRSGSGGGSMPSLQTISSKWCAGSYTCTASNVPAGTLSSRASARLVEAGAGSTPQISKVARVAARTRLLHGPLRTPASIEPGGMAPSHASRSTIARRRADGDAFALHRYHLPSLRPLRNRHARLLETGCSGSATAPLSVASSAATARSTRR